MTSPRPPSRLWIRFVLSHLAVIAVGTLTLLLTVGLVAPGAFESAMGHSMAGMGEMMDSLVRAAFREAVRTALVVAVVASGAAAVVVSLALSTRLSAPIARLARAAERIAAGRYAERVPSGGSDEIGELATAFNTMAASLEATERRRLQLVGDVAHELRTPLATLDGYLEGLEDGVVEPNSATWSLLRRETSRLARLVDDLQELWRAEARQLPLRIEPVDSAAVLREAAERFAPTAASRTITIRVDAPPGAPSVLADRERLGQVLDNLLSNALRYAPAGSEVRLGVEGGPGEVVLAVADEGPGLTEEQRELVFERFYRIDPSRSRALGGSGLGLAIVRALVELMGGRVWATSEGPGRGSTFRVALPPAG